MGKLNSMLLAVLASTGLFLAANFTGYDNTENPNVAVVDYGEIIWRMDRIRVYSESDQGMKIPDFTDEQSEKLLATLSEIETIVQELMDERHLSLVLRLDSLPDRQMGRIDFPLEKLEMSKSESNRNEVNRLLRKRVAGHKKIELTRLVIDQMTKKRDAKIPR